MSELYYEIKTPNLFLQSKAGKVYHACKVVCLVLMLQTIHKHTVQKTGFGLVLVTEDETAASSDSPRLKYHFGIAVC